MASTEQIERNINKTRNNISLTIDQLGNHIYKKVDIKEQIISNPYNAILLAAGLGFLFATATSPVSRFVVKIAARSATAAIGAYLSRKGLKYIKKQIGS